MLGSLTKNAFFHVLSWTSHRARRLVKSVAATGALAVREAIDEKKIIVKTLSSAHGSDISVIITLDSEDLFFSLSSQRPVFDKPARADVSVTRHDAETAAVTKIIWIPGRTSFSDPGTEPERPFLSVLELTPNEGRISLEYDPFEKYSSFSSLAQPQLFTRKDM